MSLTTEFDSSERVTYTNTQFFAQPGERASQSVRIKFLGVNSVYITDGTSHLLIDPFFTRSHVSVANLPGGLIKLFNLTLFVLEMFWNRLK